MSLPETSVQKGSATEDQQLPATDPISSGDASGAVTVGVVMAPPDSSSGVGAVGEPVVLPRRDLSGRGTEGSLISATRRPRIFVQGDPRGRRLTVGRRLSFPSSDRLLVARVAVFEAESLFCRYPNGRAS